MLTFKRYPLESVLVQKIELHKKHTIYGVFLENDKSDPVLYVLEDKSSELCEKTIIICQEMFEVDYDIEEINFIGGYTINRGFHKFWVFEVLSDKTIDVPKKEIKIEKFDFPPEIDSIPSVAKWARIPKPDLDKIYTKEELKAMHPERQLKYLLINKYELKGRIRNKLPLEKKIEYILRKQEGENFDPESLIDNSPIFIPKENIESILNITLDDSTPTTPMDDTSISVEVAEIEIPINHTEKEPEKIEIEIEYKIIDSSLIFKVSDDPQL